MVSNPDGSIVLSVSVDTDNLDISTKEIASSFGDLGKKIDEALSTGDTKTASLINSFKKLTEQEQKQIDKVEELKERLQGLQEIQAMESQREALGSAASGYKTSGDETAYNDALNKVTEIEARIEAARQKLNLSETSIVGDEIEKTNTQLQSASQKLEDVGNRAQIAGEKVKQLGDTSKNTASQTNRSTDAIGAGFTKLGNRIAGLVKRVFIFSVITKALRALRAAIVDYMKNDDQLGSSLETLKANLQVIGNTIMTSLRPAIQWVLSALTYLSTVAMKVLSFWTGKSVSEMKKLGGATKQTGKEAEKASKSLASFDEVTTLSGGSGGGSVDGGIESIVPEAEPSGEFDVSKISDTLGTIMEIVGGALIAVGLILLFTGHIGLGIGAIIVGLAVYSIGEAAVSDNDPTKSIKEKLFDLMGVVGLSLAVIGIILIMFGNYPFGFGVLIAGLAAFGISAYNSDGSGLMGEITKFFDNNIALILGIGAALIVIGILLIMAGLIPLGIGAIAAGAAAIVTEVALNGKAIGNSIKKFFQENATMLWGMGWALIILGILLVFTGVGIGIGIGMILAGAGMVIGAIAFNWDAIVNKVKAVGDKIKAVFSAVWNAIKNGFRVMVNGIIGYGNIWITGLNALLYPVRKIIQLIAKAFGKNVSLGTISIPKIPYLAKGGIVPYATLAMVGEKGKEAVLPLENNTEWMDTLVDKVAARIGGGFGTIEVPVSINGREIVRATREVEQSMGTQTVYGRFANAY